MNLKMKNVFCDFFFLSSFCCKIDASFLLFFVCLFLSCLLELLSSQGSLVVLCCFSNFKLFKFHCLLLKVLLFLLRPSHFLLRCCVTSKEKSSFSFQQNPILIDKSESEKSVLTFYDLCFALHS